MISNYVPYNGGVLNIEAILMGFATSAVLSLSIIYILVDNLRYNLAPHKCASGSAHTRPPCGPFVFYELSLIETPREN